MATDVRIDLANKMYNELVIMCQVGKNVWRNTSPVKYEDYVIYQTLTTEQVDEPQEADLSIESGNY